MLKKWHNKLVRNRLGRFSFVTDFQHRTRHDVCENILSLKPTTKLVAQIALASVLLLFDYRLHWVQSLTLDLLLTLVWVVGVTNAFNLIDNMDGLCGGVSMIASVALLLHFSPAVAGSRVWWEARFLAVLLGATGGFLIYNLSPASIFLGDSGSLFLGFSFAALTLSNGVRTASRSDILSIVAAPVLVLLFPIFDTALVTISRWVAGRRATEGGLDHSSHRLVAIGLSERRAVALLWCLAAVGGVLGVAVGNAGYRTTALLAGSAVRDWSAGQGPRRGPCCVQPKTSIWRLRCANCARVTS